MTPNVALFLLLSIVVLSKPKWDELNEKYSFAQYCKDFGKNYSPEEYKIRSRIFEKKRTEIISFNKHSRATYKKGVNHLTDLTEAELRGMRGNYPASTAMKPTQFQRHRIAKPEVALPYSVDYTKSVPPILTAIKDQGMCGSCWAHAATEEIESLAAMATGKLFVLSQQQLVSCVPNPLQCGGSGGCSGATAELAFDYVAKVGGITQEWMYGYSSYFGTVDNCTFDSKKHPAVKLSGYTVLKRNDPVAVMEGVAFAGPLAISVDASSWSDYESGIFTGCDYAKNITMDHAVQLVGYGTDPVLGENYWLVRNSWSPLWGEAGYIRLVREKGAPQCGWDNNWVTDGGGCQGDPNNVWACGQCGILYDTVYPNIVIP